MEQVVHRLVRTRGSRLRRERAWYAGSNAVRLSWRRSRDIDCSRPAARLGIRAEWTAGGDPEGPTSFYRVGQNLVGADTVGRFYVLDVANSHVVQLAPDGSFLRVFSRAGAGPGQLGDPATLVVDPAGISSIFDYSKMALMRFDAEGTPLEAVPFQHPPAPVAGQRHLGVLGEDYVVSTTEFSTMHYVLRRIGQDSSTVAAISLPVSEMQEYPSCGVGLRLPALLVPEMSFATQGNRIAVSTSAEYRVDIISNGAVRRSIRRDLPPVQVTHELAVRELGEGFRMSRRGNPCTISPTEMAAKRGYAEFVPRIDRIALAPDGRLWVQQRIIGLRGTGPIDVFDTDGSYLGTLPPDFPFPVVFSSDGRMGIVQRDETDIERLVVGHVVEDLEVRAATLEGFAIDPAGDTINGDR